MEIAEILNSAPFVYGNLAFLLVSAAVASLLVTRPAKLDSSPGAELKPLFASVKAR